MLTVKWRERKASQIEIWNIILHYLVKFQRLKYSEDNGNLSLWPKVDCVHGPSIATSVLDQLMDTGEEGSWHTCPVFVLFTPCVPGLCPCNQPSMAELVLWLAKVSHVYNCLPLILCRHPIWQTLRKSLRSLSLKLQIWFCHMHQWKKSILKLQNMIVSWFYWINLIVNLD